MVYYYNFVVHTLPNPDTIQRNLSSESFAAAMSNQSASKPCINKTKLLCHPKIRDGVFQIFHQLSSQVSSLKNLIIK